jgi:hypothetical protein
MRCFCRLSDCELRLGFDLAMDVGLDKVVRYIISDLRNQSRLRSHVRLIFEYVEMLDERRKALQ